MRRDVQDEQDETFPLDRDYDYPLKNRTLTPEIVGIGNKLMAIHEFRANLERSNRAVQSDALVMMQWKKIEARCMDYFIAENLMCGCGAIHPVPVDVFQPWAIIHHNLFEQNPDHVDDYRASRIIKSFASTLGKYRAWRLEDASCDIRFEAEMDSTKLASLQPESRKYDMGWDKEHCLGEEKGEAFELKEKQDRDGDAVMDGVVTRPVEMKNIFAMTDGERDEFIRGFKGSSIACRSQYETKWEKGEKLNDTVLEFFGFITLFVTENSYSILMRPSPSSVMLFDRSFPTPGAPSLIDFTNIFVLSSSRNSEHEQILCEVPRALVNDSSRQR
ncbi:hypothetical protein B7494_g1736 [Chlorociboria aeruginascens]|nr:hypothetical protein B7494_g1736 [Chlorociboria aeruginascens]